MEKRIIASAIKFYQEDNEYSQIICGKRHSDCFEWMFKHGVQYNKITRIQGFLTSENQFLDRREAMYYAYENGQISKEIYTPGAPLY